METVYSKAWVAANPQLYHTFAQPPEACPVCFQSFTEENPAKSPLLGECALTCRHFACEDCWAQIMDGHGSTWKCPICRADVRSWLGSGGVTYTPPVDAVGGPEFRLLAAHVIHNEPTLPAAIVALAHRILKHTSEV